MERAPTRTTRFHATVSSNWASRSRCSAATPRACERQPKGIQLSPSSPRADDDQMIGRRLGRPNFSRPAEDLAHGGVFAPKRDHLEPLALRIEFYQRVRPEVAQPHLVPLVDVDRVGLRIFAGQLPFAPAAVLGI